MSRKIQSSQRKKSDDDEDDGNDYDEEDFEEFETASNQSTEDPVLTNSNLKTDTINQISNKVSLENLNLESYMEINFNKNHENSENGDGSNRPLEGIYPKTDDTEQVLMRKRLGYSSSEGLSPMKSNYFVHII